MGYKFNPFTGNLDTVDSPNGVFEEIDVNGDITLDDGGSFTTTLQTVTPTANRTISFPDATGTVGLVAGSSGQLVYNNAGANAGVPSSVVGATGNITLSLNGAASTPPLDVTGTWFTGGTSTTTKPQVLIEPAGTTSTAWSTSGTGLGVNAASGFTGRLLDLQTNGTSRAVVTGAGDVGIGLTPIYTVDVYRAQFPFMRFCNASTGAGLGQGLRIGVEDTAGGLIQAMGGIPLVFNTGSAERARIDSSGRVLVGTSSSRSTAFGQALHQAEGTSSNGFSSITVTDNTAFGGAFVLAKTRGAAFQVLSSGDNLGILSFQGADGSALKEAARITALVDGTPGTDDMPGRLVFSTTADGAASPTERLRITSAGVLQIADAGNITVGTTTGTKIGTATTQKLGFYNATPVVQPIAVADATTAIDVITQFNALLARMRDLGLIAT